MIPLYVPFSTTPIPLPPGAYAPLEAGTEADQSSRFHGGTGFVMLVRYRASDGAAPSVLGQLPNEKLGTDLKRNPQSDPTTN